MEFRSINDLNRIIKENLYKIQEENVDLIVSIPRSGCLPATMLSLYLNIPLTDFDNFIEGKIYNLGVTKAKDNWIKNIDQAKKILIVEDSSATGRSLKEAKEKLSNNKYRKKCKFLTIFVTNKTKNLTDMYFDLCPAPRMFEWNYIHHQDVINACFDIDGVLCEDPSSIENDDGENYINFIKNAKPKFIPTFTIGCLVTARLEKYRDETEKWLRKNNIKYNKLIMLNLKTKEERVKLGNHGEFKGKCYKEMKNANIFIESDMNQAIQIANVSGKSVFCTSTSEFIKEGMIFKTKNHIKNIISKLLPKGIKKIIKKIIR